jgi:hypothetical protein
MDGTAALKRLVKQRKKRRLFITSNQPTTFTPSMAALYLLTHDQTPPAQKVFILFSP